MSARCCPQPAIPPVAHFQKESFKGYWQIPFPHPNWSMSSPSLTPRSISEFAAGEPSSSRIQRCTCKDMKDSSNASKPTSVLEWNSNTCNCSHSLSLYELPNSGLSCTTTAPYVDANRDDENASSWFEEILSESDNSLGNFLPITYFKEEDPTSVLSMTDSMGVISSDADFGCGVNMDCSPGVSSRIPYCSSDEFSTREIFPLENLSFMGDEWMCLEESDGWASHDKVEISNWSRSHFTEQPLPVHKQFETYQLNLGRNAYDFSSSNASIVESNCSLKAFPDHQPVSTHAAPRDVQVTREAQEENGLQIVHLLLACVQTIDAMDHETASTILQNLFKNTSKLGDPMQRLGFYLSEALNERMHRCLSGHRSPNKGGRFYSIQGSGSLASQAFYRNLPFLRFAYLTENQAILDAVGGEARIHVVDLDMQEGVRWASFLQSLSTNPESLVSFKLTALGSDEEALKQTGRRLTEFAQTLLVPFEFIPISVSAEEIDSSLLTIEPDEVLAVSCPFVFQRLLQSKTALSRVLTTIGSLQPNIVSVLEMELNHGSNFIERVVEALHFYSAIFDALGATLESKNPERLLIESKYLAREIVNLVAQEGVDNVGKRFQADKWGSFLRLAGLRELPISSTAVYQANMFIASQCTSYTLNRDLSLLTLGWHNTPIACVSTWTF